MEFADTPGLPAGALSATIVRAGSSGGMTRIASPPTITEAETDVGVSILNQAIADVTHRGWRTRRSNLLQVIGFAK